MKWADEYTSVQKKMDHGISCWIRDGLTSPHIRMDYVLDGSFVGVMAAQLAQASLSGIQDEDLMDFWYARLEVKMFDRLIELVPLDSSLRMLYPPSTGNKLPISLAEPISEYILSIQGNPMRRKRSVRDLIQSCQDLARTLEIPQAECFRLVVRNLMVRYEGYPYGTEMVGPNCEISERLAALHTPHDSGVGG